MAGSVRRRPNQALETGKRWDWDRGSRRSRGVASYDFYFFFFFLFFSSDIPDGKSRQPRVVRDVSFRWDMGLQLVRAGESIRFQRGPGSKRSVHVRNERPCRIRGRGFNSQHSNVGSTCAKRLPKAICDQRGPAGRHGKRGMSAAWLYAQAEAVAWHGSKGRAGAESERRDEKRRRGRV
ncbi:hypothetical protein IWX90DRAFT_309339 [Phyllosticta citrichinensis]|uniref:Uncharacterized protein n=1 Tax=Phyllosticta citrichinensis TaxID=1130410 RepID=A0ABR1XLX7_9PEZI